MFFLSQAGNVVTGEMVEELILSGADIIKVGVGPGKTCRENSRGCVGGRNGVWGLQGLEDGQKGAHELPTHEFVVHFFWISLSFHRSSSLEMSLSCPLMPPGSLSRSVGVVRM